MGLKTKKKIPWTDEEKKKLNEALLLFENRGN